MRAFVSLTLLASFLVSMPAVAEPFGFRGVSLGGSIADVRRLRYPEAPAARVVCLHDQEAANIRPAVDHVTDETETRAGVTSCGVFAYGQAFSGMQAEWLPAQLKHDDLDVRATFWIVPERQGSGVESTPNRMMIVFQHNGLTPRGADAQQSDGTTIPSGIPRTRAAIPQ